MSPAFDLTNLQPMIQALKDKLRYNDWLTRLQAQEEWIRIHFPTISEHRDIENLRTALKSVKPCAKCDKKYCPKQTARYTYVGEITWWNDQTYLRWVPDCRDAKKPPPTAKTYREQIETDQAALKAAQR